MSITSLVTDVASNVLRLSRLDNRGLAFGIFLLSCSRSGCPCFVVVSLVKPVTFNVTCFYDMIAVMCSCDVS